MSGKRKSSLVLAVLLLGATMTARGQQATSSSFTSMAVNNVRLPVLANSTESYPAEQDPEGNWGNPVCGLQLSVRFSTNVFRAGDRIIATVLLRNVTNSPVSHGILKSKDSIICRFRVARDGWQTIERNEDLRFLGAVERTLAPGTQWKVFQDMTEVFRLDSPGTYVVSAQTTTGEAAAEVQSADVLIRIVEKPVPNSIRGVPETQIEVQEPSPNQLESGDRQFALASGRSTLSSGASAAANLSPSKKVGNLPEPISLSGKIGARLFTSPRKLALGVIGSLLAFLILIFWRASRRKPSS